MFLNESRELDRLRKSSNEKINKAKEILKDNEKNINSHIDKIQSNYRSRSESSMFDGILFDEFTMLDEGKQAEEYKARKAKEHDEEFRNSQKRTDSRKDAGKKNPNGYAGDKHVYDDLIRNDMSSAKAHKMMKQTNRNRLDDYVTAKDATNRHLRRHPKTESALMLIAGYDSEFAY